MRVIAESLARDNNGKKRKSRKEYVDMVKDVEPSLSNKKASIILTDQVIKYHD